MPDQHARTTDGLRIRIEGSVQGVGFRPWVHALATHRSLAGRVWNEGGSVTIEAFGDSACLQDFLYDLKNPPMPAARIAALRADPIPSQDLHDFTIVASAGGSDRRPAIPPDLATCPDCLRELFDPEDRRHRYALTNCTRCGPRYTIATGVPYDRERTTMAGFPMCETCRAEYESPDDRRFHAQPNACPACGPHLELVEPGQVRDGSARDEVDPVEHAAALLRRGHVVAVKGLGGYHLACDAESEAAVERLRRRKRRYAKPLAVMVPSPGDAEAIAILTDADRDLLTSPVRPIVLVRRREDGPLASSVAPDTTLVGVLLPYTPLHELLLRTFGGPLVMTSGNTSDEPMATDDDDALARLGGGIADALLRHDRPIAARCDDSIARVLDGEPVVLRRGRGWTPASIPVAQRFPMPVLACGAHLKNAFCLGDGALAWMGPHVGDLETEEACAAFERSVAGFARFVGIAPEVVAHDRHPDYFTTRWARSCGADRRIAVQHHHAHVASAMVDSGVEGPVLGLAWDGTGDGGDGTAWGGELLAADHAGFVRVATLRPLALAGGDAAIRDVWRIALAALDDAFDGDPPLSALRLFDRIAPAHVELVRGMIRTNVNAPLAHGAGRWFDALGALALGRATSRYEGEVASAFGMAAAPGDFGAYELDVAHEVRGGSPLPVFDLRPAVRALAGDLVEGVPPAIVAARFHATLAAVAGSMVAAGERRFGRLPVVLTGGCFQNELLLRSVTARLSGRTRVVRHRRVPPNDGGIALGQAVVAAAAIGGRPCALGRDAVTPEVS